ncbi:bacillithiol biosynthesis cysteine-adding enzyme BshC [soil metagenome]
MEANCTYLSYAETNYFSKLVLDYINNEALLKPFYTQPVNINGIKAAIEARKSFSQQRTVLVQELQNQYEGVEKSDALIANINLLLRENTFTVTTAHQPNIFTGPLYFIYKILHTIKLAQHLKQQLPENNFVPVYYMGSEDADLEEIGSFYIDGVKYVWNTQQTGAVGRMKVDKDFLKLIVQMHGQLGVLPQGIEVINLFTKVYTIGKTIQHATLELVNTLFGAYGLVILIPDNPRLKKLFEPVVTKELTEQFSHKAVTATIAALQTHYKAQAGGRELNLFYLVDDKRERIEISGSQFTVAALDVHFSKDEIIKELQEHPERFSANVILRGAFQETVLPNIAFIGGGGELAYWLELKQVFEAIAIPYPVLILRNSFLLIEEKVKQKIDALGLSAAELFRPNFELMHLIVARQSANKFSLNGGLKEVEDIYEEIMQLATNIDTTLNAHVAALKVKAVKKLYELEKKMLRAEKRKFEAEQRQVEKIRSILFPNNSLQERVENIALYYAKYGNELFDILLQHSLALEQQFAYLDIKA